MKKRGLNRRKFITRTSLGVLGAGLISKQAFGWSQRNRERAAETIIHYRTLGRTGFQVSDIGTGAPYSEQLLRATLETGVNFIETSESYSNGRNELMIGKVIKDFERAKLFIATKANPTFRVFKSADDIIRRAEDSLGRLKTDYIDLYMIHQAQNIIRVKDKYFHRATEKLKREGKIRFTGLSCHGPTWGQGERESLEDILMSAVENGGYDVLFFPYNFLYPYIGERVLKACRERNIGTMIMKSNPVVVYDNFEKILNRGGELGRREQEDYEGLKSQMENAAGFFRSHGLSDIEKLKDASIQFILTNRDVNTICCRFPNYPDIERYTRLSGTTIDKKSAMLLSGFKDNLGFLNCRIGCNSCSQSCPHNIPVNEILRYNYYFVTRNMQKHSMKLYQNPAIKKPVECENCPGYCEKACPHGVITRHLLATAHQNMNFS